MKAFIHFEGDTSVGIWPSTFTLDLGNCNSDAKEVMGLEREEFRKALWEALGELLSGGERGGVFFEDECQDCGKVMKRQRNETPRGEKSTELYVCKNKSCISNAPADAFD